MLWHDYSIKVPYTFFRDHVWIQLNWFWENITGTFHLHKWICHPRQLPRYRILIWPISHSRKIILQQHEMWITMWIIIHGHFICVDTFLLGQNKSEMLKWKFWTWEAFLNPELKTRFHFLRCRNISPTIGITTNDVYW
jgi:hypothetical protein